MTMSEKLNFSSKSPLPKNKDGGQCAARTKNSEGDIITISKHTISFQLMSTSPVSCCKILRGILEMKNSIIILIRVKATLTIPSKLLLRKGPTYPKSNSLFWSYFSGTYIKGSYMSLSGGLKLISA